LNSALKNYLFLIIIYLALTGLGYIAIRIFPLDLSFNEIIILLTGALIITMISSLIFFRGLKNSERKGVLHTLSAVGIKFLLFLALLGIFAIMKKEISWHFLVIFFVIYLTYTFYLLVTFINVLKLKNQAKIDD